MDLPIKNETIDVPGRLRLTTSTQDAVSEAKLSAAIRQLVAVSSPL